MRKKALLTTGEVAAHCGVSYEAVKEWVKTGKLTAYVTPGKHRRIPAEAFKQFLQKYHWPPFDEVERSTARRKVLVVDDDPAVAAVTVKLLRRANRYDLETADNGFAAGIQVVTFAPDLVILDLMMPQLDGFQVCKMIKSTPETAQIKVLVLTGYHSEENEQKALECGADACLGKPVKGDALRDKVAELLASAQRISLSA